MRLAVSQIEVWSNSDEYRRVSKGKLSFPIFVFPIFVFVTPMKVKVNGRVLLRWHIQIASYNYFFSLVMSLALAIGGIAKLIAHHVCNVFLFFFSFPL